MWWVHTLGCTSEYSCSYGPFAKLSEAKRFATRYHVDGRLKPDGTGGYVNGAYAVDQTEPAPGRRRFTPGFPV